MLRTVTLLPRFRGFYIPLQHKNHFRYWVYATWLSGVTMAGLTPASICKLSWAHNADDTDVAGYRGYELVLLIGWSGGGSWPRPGTRVITGATGLRGYDLVLLVGWSGGDASMAGMRERG